MIAAIRSLLDPGNWLGMKPALDPSAAVLSLDYRPAEGLWKLRMMVGGAVLAITAIVIYFSPGGIVTLVAGGFGLFALLNLVRGLAESRFEKSLLITDNMVIVKSRTFFGRNDWQEPIANYRGVLLREWRTTGNSVGNTPDLNTYQIIELAHDDPGRTTPLYVADQSKSPRDIQEAFALRFDLPALQPDGDAYAAREPEALDRPTGLVAAANGGDGDGASPAAPSIDPGPAPSGVTVTRNGDAIRIMVGQGAVGRSFTWLFWLAIPCLFGGVVFILDPYMGIVAFGMSAVFVLMILGLRRLFGGSGKDSEHFLGLDANRIWVKHPKEPEFVAKFERAFTKLVRAKPLERPTEESMGRDAIEQVRVDQRMTRIRTSSGDHRTAYVWQLIIENDEDRLVFAGGQFDQGKMEWVRDFLRHELTRSAAE